MACQVNTFSIHRRPIFKHEGPQEIPKMGQREIGLVEILQYDSKSRQDHYCH